MDENEFDMSKKHVVLELKKEVDKLQNDSTDLHCIISKLKVKFLSTLNFSEKLQSLTLVPQSWSLDDAPCS